MLAKDLITARNLFLDSIVDTDFPAENRYKNTVEAIDNYPALLVRARTQEHSASSRGRLGKRFVLDMFVIDQVKKYGNEREQDTIEDAQIYVLGKFNSILDNLEDGCLISFTSPEINLAEDVIDGKKIVIAQGRIILE